MPLQRDFQILSDEAATREVMHSASLGRGGSGGGAWEGMGSGGGWGGGGVVTSWGQPFSSNPSPAPQMSITDGGPMPSWATFWSGRPQGRFGKLADPPPNRAMIKCSVRRSECWVLCMPQAGERKTRAVYTLTKNRDALYKLWKVSPECSEAKRK